MSEHGWPAGPFRNTAGDNARAAWAQPEVVAAERRILTLADALVTWMRTEEWQPDEIAHQMADFFTHTTNINPGCGPDDPAAGVTKVWILDKMDRDANRLFVELLRATWDRRCWRAHYGEIEETRRL